MSPVVVVDDVSPVVRTGDVDRIRYRGSGVDGVPKTQHTVLFVCCVGDVHRKSQEPGGIPVFCVYKNIFIVLNKTYYMCAYFSQTENV